MNYRILRIPKGRGKYRTLYVPDAELRQKLAGHRAAIFNTMVTVCDFRLCHGFMPARSPQTNAQEHAGYQHTLSMDLRDFFDSVTEQHLTPFLSQAILQDCLIGGAPRQGLPTSPALSNIAASRMDRELAALGVRYTRYADDLTFSSDSLEELEFCYDRILECVHRHRFLVQPAKTLWQHARGGNRVIAGVSVGDSGTKVPRRLWRRARAAEHRGHPSAAMGMRVWCSEPRWRCPLCWRRLPERWMRGHIQMFHRFRLPDTAVADFATLVTAARDAYVESML